MTMTKIAITLTIGGERETEVENYDAKIVAKEIEEEKSTVVSVGDVAFNKNFFVSTSPVKVTEVEK